MKFTVDLLGTTFMPFRKYLIYKNQFVTDIFLSVVGQNKISQFHLGNQGCLLKSLSVEFEDFFFNN